MFLCLSVCEKFVWQADKQFEYQNNLKNYDTKLKLDLAILQIDDNVNEALDNFTGCLKSAGKCLIKKSSSGNRLVGERWFDNECRELKCECRKKLKIYRKKSTDENRLDYTESRKKYRATIKQKKQAFQRDTAESMAKNTKNSAVFWEKVRKLGHRGIGGRTNNKITLEEWYQHFKNVFTLCDSESLHQDRGSSEIQDEDSVLNVEISEEEVVAAIKNLNNKKAGGMDGVIPEMLKYGGPDVVNFLTKLFNKVFDNGIYPEEWAKAIVVPIFKKGDRDVPDNYRGISLINIVCKCYTFILNKRLAMWLEEKKTIVENQAGFRKQYSTVDQIFNLYAIVQKCLSRKGQKLYVAFVDFKKAFDSVNHQALLDIVYKEGINGKFFSSLKAMYQSLTACVRANCEFTDFFPCPVGVRQGCVMSPTLFSLFINQLANHITEVGLHGIQLLPNFLEIFILLFADDVVLLSYSPIGLQSQLNALKNCCERLKLSVNKDKTKIMVFRKGGFLGKNEKWFYEGKQLEVVNSYCYLGFIFSTMLSNKIGTSHLVTRGKKSTYFLSSAFRNCKDLSRDVYFKIFDSKVQSVLLYAAEIWGCHRLDNIEKVHLIACKRFLGVPSITPNKMVYSELERYPLYLNSCIRSIKYWFRLLEMSIDRLPKQAYTMLCILDQNGQRCWVTEIKELLSRAGFYLVWLNQGVQDYGRFLLILKQRLKDVFIQEWDEVLRDKERYNLYRVCQSNFRKAPYLDKITVYCFRVALAQIRMGVLPINNNLNRFKENLREAMCPWCSTQVENESHFLFHCSLYTDLRTRFINSSLDIRTQVDGNNISIAKNVSKFIFHAIKRRQRFIEN